MHTTQKKILYVITKSNFGGAQRYVYELATSLPKNEFDVSVATGGTGVLTEMLAAAGVRTFTIPHFARDINFLDEFRAMRELMGIIRELRPDILHLNSSKAGGTGALAGRLLRVPRIIFTAHGWPFFEQRSFLWRSFVWLFSYVTALLSHRVILVSEHDRSHMHMPLVDSKCSVIRTAVPERVLHSRTDARATLFTHEEIDAHERDVWVVTVAEMTRNKNLTAALRAVWLTNRYSARKVFYTIIGDGELRPEIEKFISKFDLADSVKLTGHVPDAPVFLSAFDAFLLPSLKEGMPYAVLEAGAAALPTIAANVGGIPEIIQDSVTGLLIDPRNPEAMVTALRDLATHPEETRAYGEALQTRIREQFNITAMLERTYTLYRS